MISDLFFFILITLNSILHFVEYCWKRELFFYFHRPSAEAPSPIEALQQKLSLKKILASALPVIHDSIVSFHKLREDIYSELAQLEQVAGIKVCNYEILL